LRLEILRVSVAAAEVELQRLNGLKRFSANCKDAEKPRKANVVALRACHRQTRSIN